MFNDVYLLKATSSRGGITSGQRLWSTTGNSRQGTQTPWQARLPANKLSIHAAALLAEVDTRNVNSASNKINASPELQVMGVANCTPLKAYFAYFSFHLIIFISSHSSHHALLHSLKRMQIFQAFPEANGSLPRALYRLVDPSAPVEFPPPGTVKLSPADNRELDKLVAALGRNKSTWRRALMLHEWLLQSGHKVDDRLCTSLIRVCAQHGQAATALQLYDWMRTPKASGGGGMDCTVYTYTAAMRAALTGNMLDDAMRVWGHAEADHPDEIDCRLCTTLIEVCSRRSDVEQALKIYKRMKDAPKDSKLAPSVHAFTAAMRAAAEGGKPAAALSIWDDMQAAGCKATGHAYSAVISACTAGGEWQRAVALFDEMLAWNIKPDVVSCTALITALGVDGQWERAEKVVEWMLRSDIRPNVRTYTALVGALSNARQWNRAKDLVRRMKSHALGQGLEPNAYTYSAMLKAMGDHGQWAMAEDLFTELEAEAQAALTNPSNPSQECPEDTGDGTESLEERLITEMVVARTAELALGVGDGKDSNAQEMAILMSNQSTLRTPFSYFSSQQDDKISIGTTQKAQPAVKGDQHLGDWTVDIAASCGLQFDLGSAVNGRQHTSAGMVQLKPALESGIISTSSQAKVSKPRGVVNEVVCGALMIAYERAGKWSKAVEVIDRAKALGLEPNTVMYNIALSALGKAGQVDLAREMFGECSQPDAVTYETMIAAYGMAGRPNCAEEMLVSMRKAGFVPQDYAYCGLIAAYGLTGNWKAAFEVKERARRDGVPPSVHLYNALMAACERARMYDKAVALGKEMVSLGISPNVSTRELLDGVCRSGVAAVEAQQATITALSAAVAAAGTVMIRAGIF
jgi:pentatricopeptide repeat protein